MHQIETLSPTNKHFFRAKQHLFKVQTIEVQQSQDR